MQKPAAVTRPLLPAAALHSVNGIEFHTNWVIAAATPWIGALLAIPDKPANGPRLFLPICS